MSVYIAFYNKTLLFIFDILRDVLKVNCGKSFVFI